MSSRESDEQGSLAWRRDLGWQEVGFASKVARGLCSMPGCYDEAVFVKRDSAERRWGLCLDHTYQRMRKPPP